MKFILIIFTFLFLFSCSYYSKNIDDNLNEKTEDLKNPQPITIPVSDNNPNL